MVALVDAPRGKVQVACLSLAACAGSGFISSGQQSDHLLLVAAYNAWEDAKAQVRLPLPPTVQSAREWMLRSEYHSTCPLC